MRRTYWIAIIWIVITGLVIAKGASAQESEKKLTVPTEYSVRIPKSSDKFEPALLKIKVGDTVKWINEDDRKHVIASIPGKGTNDKELFAPQIAPGSSWSHTFSKPGDYPYFCYIHYVMMGAIIVEEEQGQAK